MNTAAGQPARAEDHPAQAAAGAELLSHLGHALRSPLNSILGFTQILALDRMNPLSAVQKERVDQIQTAGWQLLQLIDDMVDLARIEAGHSSIARAPVALEPPMRESLAQFASQVAAGRIQLDPGAHLDGVVAGDAARLRQALVSVLGGALRCVLRGGSLLIGARRQAGGGALVWIRDSAQSLPAGQLERTFLPLGRRPLDDGPGQGVQIGLALAQKLIEQMGGRLRVHCDPQAGSELQIELAGPGGPKEPPLHRASG